MSDIPLLKKPDLEPDSMFYKLQNQLEKLDQTGSMLNEIHNQLKKAQVRAEDDLKRIDNMKDRLESANRDYRIQKGLIIGSIMLIILVIYLCIKCVCGRCGERDRRTNSVPTQTENVVNTQV